MANTILHKRSLISGSTPTTASLSVGEIAINVNDGKLFIRQSGSNIDRVIPLVSVGIVNTGSIIGSFSGNLIGTSSFATSASFATNALTASYAENANVIDTGSFATTGSNTFNGNQIINGYLNVTNPITGTLNGTSSWAVTSSYALTAAYAENATNTTSSVLQPSYHITGAFGVQDTVEIQLPTGSGGFPVGDIDRIIYTLMIKEASGSNWRNDLASVELKISSSHIYAVLSAPTLPYSYSFNALNQNITSSTTYTQSTASYALTAAYAENISNITNVYNNLREIVTGTFDANGTKLIELQKFLNTDIDYITLDITTKPSGTSYYTNDLISFYMSGNLNNKLEIQLSAPAYGTNDRYKIIAVKETGSF